MKSVNRLDFKIDGPSSDQTMFFIHGWPDDENLWDKQVEYFSKKYRCIRVSLPQFKENSTDLSCPQNFTELIEILNSTISAAQENSDQKKVILVGHDWGAFLSYLLCKKFPEVIDKVITMDVGADMSTSSIGHSAFIVSYQWWLIVAWWVGKVSPFLGNSMSKVLASKYGAPNTEKILARKNYLYYLFWKNLFTKKESDFLFSKYQIKHPLLYLFGKDKKYMFHSKQWEVALTESNNSEIQAIPKARHWLMVDRPQVVNEIIESWLDSLSNNVNA